jgi:hypothetical protein
VWGYFRFGLSDSEIATRLPGLEQDRIEPVFGQCTVIVEPSASLTSTRKRLYLFMRVAIVSGGVKIMFFISKCGNYDGFLLREIVIAHQRYE